MPIKYIKGDMFTDRSEAIVNTVNCVGIMGKGVALEFKKRWPQNFKEYKKVCDDKTLSPGLMFIHDNSDMFNAGPRYLINFPTKQHWRSKSKISFIEAGLDDLVNQVRKLRIQSVALPPLGCGNGGLEWQEVRKLVETKLAELSEVDFHVYVPEEHQIKPEYQDVPPDMTAKRAVIVKAIGDFESYFGGSLTRICVQKIIYFLNALGVDYSLDFARNHHGPYSEALKDILSKMEAQNYITGYSLADAEIRSTTAAYSMAEEFLAQDEHKPMLKIIRKLSLLIEGYENPYGMEILASVHFLVEHEGIRGEESIIKEIRSWNDHKKTQFSKADIVSAYSRLRSDKILH